MQDLVWLYVLIPCVTLVIVVITDYVAEYQNKVILHKQEIEREKLRFEQEKQEYNRCDEKNKMVCDNERNLTGYCLRKNGCKTTFDCTSECDKE